MNAEKLAAFRKSEAAKPIRELRIKAARVAFYYHQYTLEDVLEMTSGDIDLLLQVAEAELLRSKRFDLNGRAAVNGKNSYKELLAKYNKTIKALLS